METLREFALTTLVVLGSGQSGIARRIKQASRLSFNEIPGMPAASVAGHKGCLTVGELSGLAVLVAEGRVHGYEGHDEGAITRLIGVAAELGVQEVILTNAAGGIREDLVPGMLMPLNSQLDWQRARLPSVEPNAYSPELLDIITAAGPFWPGCYAAVAGPSYETPAEIRALRRLGVDAVGMSTVPEARAAAALGMRVAGISLITNKAAGLATGTLDHGDVLAAAQASSEKMADLIERVMGRLRA